MCLVTPKLPFSAKIYSRSLPPLKQSNIRERDYLQPNADLEIFVNRSQINIFGKLINKSKK